MTKIKLNVRKDSIPGSCVQGSAVSSYCLHTRPINLQGTEFFIQFVRNQLSFSPWVSLISLSTDIPDCL